MAPDGRSREWELRPDRPSRSGLRLEDPAMAEPNPGSGAVCQSMLFLTARHKLVEIVAEFVLHCSVGKSRTKGLPLCDGRAKLGSKMNCISFKLCDSPIGCSPIESIAHCAA